MSNERYLTTAVNELTKLKSQAEKALAQLDDSGYFARLDPESNSIAFIVKHVAGNMRSRWTDFLTTDGEKPDRDRDSEFEEQGDTRASLTARWEAGWSRLFDTLRTLGPGDLERQVTIRGESMPVLEAIQRATIHYAGHIGQIVFLAKHYAGPSWQTLSIPKRR